MSSGEGMPTCSSAPWQHTCGSAGRVHARAASGGRVLRSHGFLVLLFQGGCYRQSEVLRCLGVSPWHAQQRGHVGEVGQAGNAHGRGRDPVPFAAQQAPQMPVERPSPVSRCRAARSAPEARARRVRQHQTSRHRSRFSVSAALQYSLGPAAPCSSVGGVAGASRGATLTIERNSCQPGLIY